MTASNRGSVPPKPDPCLVKLYITGWGATKKRIDRAYREARKCPQDCGTECKRASGF